MPFIHTKEHADEMAAEMMNMAQAIKAIQAIVSGCEIEKVGRNIVIAHFEGERIIFSKETIVVEFTGRGGCEGSRDRAIGFSQSVIEQIAERDIAAIRARAEKAKASAIWIAERKAIMAEKRANGWTGE